MGLKLKNDVIFKAVFGRENEKSKQALIGMLNLLLDRKDDPIRKITYRNPFNIGSVDVQKGSILDIKAEMDHDELADIEMQLLYDNEIIPRNVYYHSGMITESLAAGEPYGKLRRTISIYILDHILFQDDDRYHKCFQLRERTDGQLLTELVEIHYIELPKVNPGHRRLPENLSDVEQFLEFLRCAGDEKDDTYLKSLKRCGGKEIQMAEVIMREITEEERLREQAIARDKFLHEQASLRRQLKEAQDILAEREEFVRQLDDFKQETEDLRQEVDEFQRMVEERQRAADEYQREAEESRRGIEEMRRQVEESRQQAEESRQQAEESRQQAEESRRENQQLKSMISALIDSGIEISELVRVANITEEELESYIK